jgi:hypothetical protein
MTTTQNQKKMSASFSPVQTQRANERDDEPSFLPTNEEIARCAYGIYVDSGWVQGQCAQNWQQAEQSLRKQGQRQSQKNVPFASYSANARGSDPIGG